MPVLVAALLIGSHPSETLTDGNASNRVTLVVLGDGYTFAERATFRADAELVVAGVFEVTPYAEYAAFFNVVVVYVDSNESGVDHPAQSIYRDTALGGAFDCEGQPQVVCADTETVLSIADEAVGAFDLALVIVNDTTYGGSGGTVPVISTHADAIELARHELAHPLAKLADEYEDPRNFIACDTPDCSEPNVTLWPTPDDTKWQDWIEEGVPLPTPEDAAYAANVGLFAGARYRSTGIYRPQLNCRMRTLGQPFCAVCAEAIVRAIYDRVSPLAAQSPAEANVTLTWNAVQTFGVTPMTTLDDTISVAWFIDDVLQATTGDSFVLEAASLGLGTFEVAAVVADTTPLVRTDPDQALTARVTWTVTTTTCGDGTRQDSEACDDGSQVSGDGCSADCLTSVPPPPGLLAPKEPSGCDCRAAGIYPACLVLMVLGCLRRGYQARRRYVPGRSLL